MAGLAPRVDYLAGFSFPVGGLAAGKPRVLCLGAEILLSTGRELVYVYDSEKRHLTVSVGVSSRPRGARGGQGGAGAIVEFVRN